MYAVLYTLPLVPDQHGVGSMCGYKYYTVCSLCSVSRGAHKLIGAAVSIDEKSGPKTQTSWS